MKTKLSFGARLAAVFCTLLIFLGVFATPSFANNKNNPPTPNIMQATEDVAASKPLTMEEVQERSKDGALNEVQGTADAEKMIKTQPIGTPDDEMARELDKALDKVTKTK